MPPDPDNHRRRNVLRAIGATSAISLGGVGGAVAAGEHETGSGDDGEDGGESTDDARPPIVHSQFGYSGTSDEEVPERLSPDETVGLHVDEEHIDTENLPELTVEFGAFHFDPIGLQVEEGTLIEFDFETPEHSVTAYHPDQERQRRVPDGVPPFSSTVNAHGGFWLYRFEEPGVYDLFCAPHEWGGMGMRLVVGDATGPVVRVGGRPPLPLTGAVLGSGLPPEDPDLGHPKLDPEYIVDNGPITLFRPSDDDADDEPAADELRIDLSVTLSGPTPTES